MTLQELRQKYLQFWQSKSHAIIPSASLIPQNDPTTLFTSSGMQPMITYLLGEPHPEGTRIADSQKCFRAEDIDEVGDNRHTTMFEMLGNWSLGDYFKKEQLEWLWEFLTAELKLDPRKIYTSVYSGDTSQTLITNQGEQALSEDQDAIEILQSLYAKHEIQATYKAFGSVENGYQQGMDGHRIFGYDKKNWWSRAGAPNKMPSGEPGGPDAEFFYDFGTKHDTSFGQYCHPNCDCGRFIEIGNSVFMQYRKRDDAKFEELPNKNIDFGGGLERLLAAVARQNDIFLTDSHFPIIHKIEELSDQKYIDSKSPKHFRIIADHIKAAAMLAADGVIPSNKMQGYMMRRLIRRTVASGNALGLRENFTAALVAVVQDMYSEVYPEIKSDIVPRVILEEELKFRKTLGSGLSQFNRDYKKDFSENISNLDYLAQKAFDYHQSLGIPSDIFIDWIDGYSSLTLEQRQEIQEQIANLIAKHQELSRSASAGMFKGGLAEHSDITTQYHTATHLLHQALRDVLGSHVAQRGSNITAERLRFDFTHQERLTPEQIAQVETIVNEKIKAAIPVTMQQVSREEGYTAGSIGLFGEKYPDSVNVYTIGPAPTTEKLVPRDQVYSREFCGGPHVTNTAQIHGQFKIIKDEKIAKDVIRIKAQLLQN